MLIRPVSNARKLLGPLLKDVSRSFYLTLRVLPRKIRPQIGLAYLLARTTDTIADTELVPLDRRLAALNELRKRIQNTSESRLEFGDLAENQGVAAEKLLLNRCEEALSILQTFSVADQKLVREVLQTITGGQELDLQRFSSASAENIVALKTDAELDDYTYRVAGSVGEFWTKMCRQHLFPQAKLDDESLIANGVRFGKGLQLVNILRDLAADLRQGRCYFPDDVLLSAGLAPRDLLDPASAYRFRPAYDSYLDKAEKHLAAGWTYTNSLPRSEIRVRLACAWPILIGAETLKLLGQCNPIEAKAVVKVTRSEVRGLITRSILYYPFRHRWESMVPLRG